MQLIYLLRRPLVRDLGLMLLLLAASLPTLPPELDPGTPEYQKMITALGSEAALQRQTAGWWLAIAIACVALLLRRRAPLPAFILAGAAAVAHLLTPALPAPPVDLAVVITLYNLASRTARRRTAGAALAAAVSVLTVVCLIVTVPAMAGASTGEILALAASAWQSGSPSAALTKATVPALLLGIAYVAGDNTRTRRLHHAALEQRAADLQRERDQRAALAVAAERARISRELHDILAHGVSVMVVQGQGAAAALTRQPDRAAQALTSIIDTGRACLAEMRRLVAAARDDTADPPPLKPAAGLGALPALLDEARAAGTPVSLHIDGQARPVPTGVDLAAYRIVQESLTNTRKHAGAGATATVRLAYRPDRLDIDVADNGTGPDGARTRPNGNGLRGIGERAAALGGTVAFNTPPGGGFTVSARLPVGQDA